MIELFWRSGSGGHMVSALLDYCTLEGNLDGYPNFDVGNNLHSHRIVHDKIEKLFYKTRLHLNGDEITYQKVDNVYVNDTQPDICYHPKDITNIIAPIATNNLGRILISTMSVAKSRNKKLPPDDDRYEYYSENLGENIEFVAFNLRKHLLDNFESYHGHAYPEYPIDVLWFYHNEYLKIVDIIIKCGWTPKIEKIKEFCNRVLDANKPYYDILSNCEKVYQDIIEQQVKDCSLTFYETAIIHSLLMIHNNIQNPSEVKLINTLPTSTKHFFNLYE